MLRNRYCACLVPPRVHSHVLRISFRYTRHREGRREGEIDDCRYREVGRHDRSDKKEGINIERKLSKELFV